HPPYTSTLSLHDALPIYSCIQADSWSELKMSNCPWRSDPTESILKTPSIGTSSRFARFAQAVEPRIPTSSPLTKTNRIGCSSWRSEEHTSELQSRFDLVC